MSARMLSRQLNDSRFAPLSKGSSRRIRVEVSLLTKPAQFMDFADEADALAKLEPGRDGSFFFSTAASARPFLPQVEVQQLPISRFRPSRSSARPACPPASGVRTSCFATYVVQKWKRRRNTPELNRRTPHDTGIRRSVRWSTDPVRPLPADASSTEGQSGACFVRMGRMATWCSPAHGRSRGFCIDPDRGQKLPNHFPRQRPFPAPQAATWPLFCQNWDISKSRDMDRLMDRSPRRAIADTAQANGCRSVAFTYNDR